MDKIMETCITDCRECSRSCQETMAHCLRMGGKHAEPSHVLLLKDCAVVCDTAASLMVTSSPSHLDQCQICADICTKCAESCESFEDDKIMQSCAEMCRKCASSCEKMIEEHS